MRRLAALVLVGAIGAGAASGCSSSSKGYSGDVEGAFVESCTRNEAQPLPLCGCIYDEIAQQIPFDRYVELDKQMQNDETFVPDELVHIYADCSSRLTNPTTTSSPDSGSSDSTSSSSSSSSGSTSDSSSSTSSSSLSSSSSSSSPST